MIVREGGIYGKYSKFSLIIFIIFLISISIVSIIISLITTASYFITIRGRYISPIGQFLAEHEEGILILLFISIIIAVISEFIGIHYGEKK